MSDPIPPRAESRVGEPTALLEARNLTKRFGEVIANSDVDLTVLPGEVHALIGENGAGKSTLLKMIFGVYAPDEGRLFVDNAPVPPGDPAAARPVGIGMIIGGALTGIVLAMPLVLSAIRSMQRASKTRSAVTTDELPIKMLYIGIGAAMVVLAITAEFPVPDMELWRAVAMAVLLLQQEEHQRRRPRYRHYRTTRL